MKVSYLLNSFPALSETFILNEITQMIDNGHQIEIFPRALLANSPLTHANVETYHLLSKALAADVPSNLPLRSGRAALLLLRSLFHREPPPLASLDAMRFGRYAASLQMLFDSLLFAGHGPYDVIQCHFGPNGQRAAMLRDAGVLSGKIATTFHGYDVSSYPLLHGRSAYSYLFDCGDLFVAISNRMVQQLCDLGCPRDRILCLPLGIDLTAFEFTPRVHHAGAPVRILSVGRLVEKKGYRTTLKAFAAISRAHPDARYAIVGEGPLRHSLEALADSLGLQGKVEFLGGMNEQQVRRQYDQSHIFVLGSQTSADGNEEGLPQVLKEAQATGLPVVATKHSAIAEAVSDGESGFLVDEGDVTAMTACLDKLVRHPEWWPRMGSAGRTLVEERFDHEVRGRLLDEALRELVAQGSSQAGKSVFADR